MVSKSQFEDPVTVLESAETFTVRGPLAEHLKGDVQVSAMIWQGWNDGQTTGQVATATGSGGRDPRPHQAQWWTATMKVQQGTFQDGPGTGVAITVEATENPFGYETYTWVDHFQIHIQHPGGTAV
jgi:hypothetical protein